MLISLCVLIKEESVIKWINSPHCVVRRVLGFSQGGPPQRSVDQNPAAAALNCNQGLLLPPPLHLLQLLLLLPRCCCFSGAEYAAAA